MRSIFCALLAAVGSVEAWRAPLRPSWWLNYWDLTTTLALLYTALITPVEVAFIPNPPFEDRLQNGLFLANRLVDLIFICDVVVQFRVAVKLTDVGGTRWVRDPRKVAKLYVGGPWFWLDTFSIATSAFDLVPMDNVQSFTVLRAVRVLRLMKLVRLLRGSRILKKWELRVSINYAYLSVITITSSILIGCHWLGCFWGLQASFFPLNSWMSSKEYCVPWGNESHAIVMDMECPIGRPICDPGTCLDGVCVDGYACVSWDHQYTYSLYFAIMTITSVGYGDIIPDKMNKFEQLVCCFIMLASGMMWGYLIGTFCGLAAALSPSVQAFREDLSQLNSMMSIYSLPSEMRYRLREYVHETQHLRNTEARNALLTKLSPAMQGEVQLMVNQKWISKIWFLKSAEIELLIELSFNLSALVFPPREFCPAGFMYIAQRGSAFHLGRSRREGSVWGEDVILDDPDLQINIPAIAITYLWVFVMNGDRLNAIVRQFPRTLKKLVPLKRRMRCRRAVIRAAERICWERGVAFRGRLRPIYAREVKEKIEAQAAQEALHRRGNMMLRKQTEQSFAFKQDSARSNLTSRRRLTLTHRSPSASGVAMSEAETRQFRIAAQNVGMALRLRQMSTTMGTCIGEMVGGGGGRRRQAAKAGAPAAKGVRASGRQSSDDDGVGPELSARVSSIEDTLTGFGTQLERIEGMLSRMNGGQFPLQPVGAGSSSSPSPSFSLNHGGPRPPTVVASAVAPTIGASADGDDVGAGVLTA